MRLVTLLVTSAFLAGPGERVSTADSIPVSVRWNRLVPQLVSQASARRREARAAAHGDTAALRRLPPAPPFLFRIYATLSLAQTSAAQAARANRALSSDAAVATASATVLAELLPDSAVRASIERELAQDLERARGGTKSVDRVALGRRFGDSVAKRTIALVPRSADLAAPFSGSIPKGPGMWFSAPGMPPIGIELAKSHPWLLDSASQLRPSPPPSFGSPEHTAALEEVRRIARHRTPQQTAIARRWDAADPWAVWNEAASAALVRHHFTDADAARVLAVMNLAASDAIIACFDAKYTYWSIRPSQADTALALADSVGLPNFPSYPSGHACSAGAFGATLSHYVPQERAEFTRMSEEQAMSRLYGGIHYRFDNDSGLALGRRVARFAIEKESRGQIR
jgi:hypothetical protein